MKILIIVGSTRPGRTTLRMARWIEKQARQRVGLDLELIDLADYPLPALDEPVSPRFNQNRRPNPEARRWMAKIAEGDGYIFVTPEYNHSIPGVLKNALDYLTWEMIKKPATVAAHGTVGGARATMHLKEILSESRAAIIPTQLALPQMSDKINEAGELDDAVARQLYGPLTTLNNMLDELIWYAEVLAAARAASD